MKKMKRSMKSFLSLLLSLLMILTLAPTMAWAADDQSEGSLTAEYVQNNLLDTSAGTGTAEEPTPAHAKMLDSVNGVFNLGLSVTGDADTDVEVQGNANVLIVYDHSSSMNTNVQNTRYTRADQAEDVVYDFVDSLFGYQSESNPENIQVAVVTFARTGSTVQDWTSTKSQITQYFDNGGQDGTTAQNYSSSNTANNGTNWQSALSEANSLLTDLDNAGDTDPTFVILVTDGAPTASGNGNNAINPSGASLSQLRPFYEAARSDARSIQTREDTTLYGIYCYGTEADLLDDLIYYSNTGSDRPNYSGSTVATDNYFNASDTDALSSAIDSIFSDIVEALGISSVGITDGTTSEVTQTSGDVSHLLEVNKNSFQYWMSWPVVNNSFTWVNPVSGDETVYNVSMSGTTATITWNGGSVTYTNASLKNGVLVVEWTDANKDDPAPFDKDLPEAEFNDPSVDWDLSSMGTLLDGVTYEVTFECYPSQETLDLIADLKNGYVEYSDLDENVQKYLVKDGNDYKLKTNTDAVLSFEDTRTDNGQQTSEYDDPDPQKTSAAELVSISKDWSNILDSRTKPKELVMHVTRDGEDRYELTLNDDNSWKDEAYISFGILTDVNDVITVKAPGHNYSFSEPADMEYYWELVVPTLRPMLINNEPTLLVKVDESEAPSMTGDNAKAEQDGYTYYKLTIDGDVGYYKVDEAVAELKAENHRRSWLDVVKTVPDGAAEGDTFPMDMTVTNSRADKGSPNDTGSDYYVWFSVFDTNAGEIVIADDLVTGATRATDDSGDYTGYYYAPSGTTVTVNMQDGYSLRFLNLPTGSEYTIEEADLSDTAYEFVSIEGDRGYKEDPEDEDMLHEETGTVSGQSITGTIDYADSDYTVTVTNKVDHFYVYHSSDNTVECIAMSDERVKDGKFDIANETKDDLLYGGYYKAFGGTELSDDEVMALEYSKQDGGYWATDEDGTPYDGSNDPDPSWDGGKAYTEKGLEMTPENNTVYYLKEVPKTYLMPKTFYYYKLKAKTVDNVFMATAIDDANYDTVGFTVNDTSDKSTSGIAAGSTVFKTLDIKNLDATASEEQVDGSYSSGSTYTIDIKTMYAKLFNTNYYYVAEYTGSFESYSFHPYWITPDGVKQTGDQIRSQTIAGNNYDARTITPTDGQAAISDPGSGSGQSATHTLKVMDKVVLSSGSVDKVLFDQAENAETVDMHRLYNPNSGEHFYTGNTQEKEDLIAAGWNYEGIAWTAPVTSATPVYRLYNPNAGDHHYTVDAAERDALVAAGWNYEGIGWYSADAQTVPLYRLYNPNAYLVEGGSGAHHYTTSVEERDGLLALGWINEEIAWYGMEVNA